MRRMIKTEKRTPKLFQCPRGHVWESDEYSKNFAGGRIHRMDFCPKCDRIGENIKSQPEAS